MRVGAKRLRRGARTVWLFIALAMSVVAVIGAAIGLFDVRRDVRQRRDEQISRLMSHAERSAAHIASQLQEDGTPQQIAAIASSRWLRTYWTQTLNRQPYRLYAAIIGLDGTVIAHTNREQEGRRIEQRESSAAPPLFAEHHELIDDVLTNNQRAIDVRVPIRQEQETIGVYHAGIDADWLEEKLADEATRRTWFWIALVGGTCGVLLLSSGAVVQVTRHTARLEHELEAAEARRVSEMHELVLGIAHEIRNPLNAIRLNMHTVGQVFRDEAALSSEEIATMLDEMEDEVARLETLMREMLGFARAGGRQSAPVDVTDEIRRTTALLRSNLEQHEVRLVLNLTDEPCRVAADATRLRQVLINLINNAVEAMGAGGRIEIATLCEVGQVVIRVIDDGPGIAAEDRQRVFIPFFSTKATGTGLGLALARKFIEEAGGTLSCEESPLGHGSCFRILLPAASGAALESVS
jgi:two-component system, NtrC family, sensor histidine kinase HydH